MSIFLLKYLHMSKKSYNFAKVLGKYMYGQCEFPKKLTKF
jgi:hypothetical protein